jgi:hypothetical protein
LALFSKDLGQTSTLPRRIDHEATGSEIGGEPRHHSGARARAGAGAAAGDALGARPDSVPRLGWQLPSDRLRKRTLDIDAEEAAAKARLLSEHREYQWTKRELGRLLGLSPGDTNPLERIAPSGPDDPRTRRALWLSFRLNEAYLDQLLWWRQPPRLRVVAS